MLYYSKLHTQEKTVLVAGTDKWNWKPIFVHSILLSNGWEIRLRFHKLAATRTTSLLSASAHSQLAGIL
jgi:hypothetical protein